MAAKKKANASEQTEVDPRFAPVVEAFIHKRDVTYGKLMSSYGLKVKGKIFAMFGKGKFVTKLPRQRVDELVTAGKGRRFDPGHGRVMKEWVVVESGKADWVELAGEAYAFVKQTNRE